MTDRTNQPTCTCGHGYLKHDHSRAERRLHPCLHSTFDDSQKRYVYCPCKDYRTVPEEPR